MLVAYANGLALFRALRPIVEAIRSHSAEMANRSNAPARVSCSTSGKGRIERGVIPGAFYAMAQGRAQGSAAEIRAALDTCEAWGWNVDASNARALLDRELGLLWGSPIPERPNLSATSSRPQCLRPQRHCPTRPPTATLNADTNVNQPRPCPSALRAARHLPTALSDDGRACRRSRRRS